MQVRIFAGSFGGPTLWENPEFVSPNEVRAAERGRQGGKYAGRLIKQSKQQTRREDNQAAPDPLADTFV